MPNALTATQATTSALTATAEQLFAGTYPGATTYPGADVYPGRGNDLVALTATSNVLAAVPA